MTADDEGPRPCRGRIPPLLGLLGGLITGIPPCILPVLPILFLSGGAQGARLSPAGNPSTVNGTRRPYLVVAALVLSFSVFTLLGALVLSSLSSSTPRAPSRQVSIGEGGYDETGQLIRALLDEPAATTSPSLNEVP